MRATTMADATCASCKFFARPDGNGFGQCRANPPSGTEGQWPRVTAVEWCGAFVFAHFAEQGRPYLPARTAA